MNPIPTLSTSGIITDPEAGMARLFADYAAAEVSATKLYRKSLRALVARVAQIDNPAALAEAIQTDLENIYKGAFDTVDVSVVDESEEVEGGQYALGITLIVTDNGRQYSLSKALTTNNRSIVEVI